MSMHYQTVWSWKSIAAFCVLVLGTGCGEPMDFENAGSKRALAEDQQTCDHELQTPAWGQYVKESKGRLDPWQVCMERKGWKRVDRPGAPSASVKS